MDTQALQRLIDAHGAALTLYARQWCRCPDDAVQEALVELIRQTEVPRDIPAWLYTVVRRRAMNLGRAETRRKNHQRQAGSQRKPWFLPPENDLEQTIDYESLLDQLPDLEREIVVARIWGELSLAQVAQLVNLSVSSVHRRYQQALGQLADLMDTSQSNDRDSDEPSTPFAQRN